jgi:hypothetical protein
MQYRGCYWDIACHFPSARRITRIIIDKHMPQSPDLAKYKRGSFYFGVPKLCAYLYATKYHLGFLPFGTEPPEPAPRQRIQASLLPRARLAAGGMPIRHKATQWSRWPFSVTPPSPPRAPHRVTRAHKGCHRVLLGMPVASRLHRSPSQRVIRSGGPANVIPGLPGCFAGGGRSENTLRVIRHRTNARWGENHSGYPSHSPRAGYIRKDPPEGG